MMMMMMMVGGGGGVVVMKLYIDSLSCLFIEQTHTHTSLHAMWAMEMTQ
jgi:hypothetical protein